MAHYIQDSYGLHDDAPESLKRGPLVSSHPVEPQVDHQAGPEAGYVSYNAYPPNPSTPNFTLSHKEMERDMEHGGYNGNYNHNDTLHFNGNYGGPDYGANGHGTYTESESPAPTPQPHPQSYQQGQHDAHAQRQQVYNTVTPGADNFSESAAGGVAAIAYGVAERGGDSRLPPPPSQAYAPDGGTGMPRMANPGQGNGNGGRYTPRDPNAGVGPLGPPAVHPPSSRSPSLHEEAHYQLYSNSPRNNNSSLGIVNPNEIMDDGDDGLDYSKHGLRDSNLSGSGLGRGARGVGAGAGAGAGAAGSGALGRQVQGNKGGGQMTEYDITTGQEKSPEWLAKKASKRKMWRWIIIVGVILVIAGAVVGGVVGGLVTGSKKGGKVVGGSGSSSGGGAGGGGGGGAGGGIGKGLNINSPEIKALLNNKNLHKVFPGVDYTPLNTQYPDCLANPPSQDDITKDVAVLSQLTNKVRLYGTDCKQTEMVLYAIQQLKMADKIKVWLGVWQDNNATTNTRQLDQMWTILDQYGAKPFEGVIVANEALFRQQFTVTTLGNLLDSVRDNMTAHNYNLRVATSDLGDDWTTALGAKSDLIMANVHPFFSGTPAEKAAAWTWSFWSDHDGPFWKKDESLNVIAETGWPSGGGTDCGGPTTCTDGAVAGIDEMNRFMEDWVCQALANGTNYFWFEAFDEPWKVSFNEPGKEWEDKWGLMDSNRNLKKGVQIPDCGGKTV